MSNSTKRESQTPDRPVKTLLIGRAILFFEIMIILLFNFLLYLILNAFFRIDPESTEPMDVITLYYIEPLGTLIIGSILGLFVINILFKDKQINPSNKDIPPIVDVYSCFKVTKSNFKYQILYTALLLFLVYIPLDFLGYCIPGVLDFSIGSFSNSVSLFLFIEPQYNIFIGFAVIMYICVAFKEELLFRAISISRGRRYIGNYSSVILFSFSFAMSHFAYLLISDNPIRDFIPALTWGISAFIIGLAMGTFFIKKRYIIPLILSHAINNIISATTLWLYNVRTFTFASISLYLYLPLFLVSIILLIIFIKNVKSGLSAFKKIGAEYFDENSPSKITMILIDVLLGLVLFYIIIFLF